MTDPEILETLQRETAGRLFMSESDYPFELIEWGIEPTADFLRKLTDEPNESEVEELQVEQFLAAGQYDRLLHLFKTDLTHSKAYKVGLINMPVYVVGRSKSGKWLGIATRVVWT